MVRGATKRKAIPNPLALLVMVGIVVSIWFLLTRSSKEVVSVQADEPVEVEQPTVAPEDLIGEVDYEYIVQEGDVLSSIFQGHEIPFTEIVALESAGDESFSFSSVQVGKVVYVNLYEEGSDLRLEDVFYQPDASRVIHAHQTSGGWVIEEKEIVYEIRQVSTSGTVESSLYVSALAAGLDDKVILNFADVFAWDIDFALQTRSGDEYKMIFEEKYLKGEKVTSGRILAGEYVNFGNAYQAFFFESGDTKGYFDEEGNALQKAFLKAPVNYRYVTSGFSAARFHPIIGKVIPHNGVDYAAPYGTPIIAVADGIVSNQGWMGAYGNRIEVKHGDRYGSQYSHMSAYAELQIGDPVKQGQVVGYVGSTGYSTGNHVHFSMTERGNYVNPDTVDVPDGEPIPEELKDEYLSHVEELKTRLSE